MTQHHSLTVTDTVITAGVI